MKKRNIMMFSVIALVVALVAGGTMAWFTADAEPIINTFTAGTVDIEMYEAVGKYTFDDGEYLYPDDLVESEGFEFENVNPGDQYVKEITIENTGSKDAFVRVSLESAWDPDELAHIEEITFETVGNNDGEWVLDDGFYYYNVPISTDDITNVLVLTINFPGEDMDNDYQEAVFSLEVLADAIQASNGAALDVWEIDPSTLP